MSDTWSTPIANMYARIKDSVLHYSLKLNLTEHVWSTVGNSENENQFVRIFKLSYSVLI